MIVINESADVLRHGWYDAAATLAADIPEVAELLQARLEIAITSQSLDERHLLDTIEEVEAMSSRAGSPASEALALRLRRTVYEYLLALDAVVPGRAPAADSGALTVDDFAWNEHSRMIDACPAGHRPTSCSHDAETATTRVEMPASACAECPFRKQCPIENTRDGKFTLEFTDKARRLAGRRVEEATEVFKER